MPTPLTERQYQKCKELPVCSYSAYLRTFHWYYENCNKALQASNIAAGFEPTYRMIPYGKSHPVNKKSRFFYSNWLQSKVFWYFTTLLEKRDVTIPYDRGTSLRLKDGKTIFIKCKSVKVGQADVVVSIPMAANGVIVGTKLLNIEVKARKDVMSEAQRLEQARTRAKGQIYEIIRNMDEFWAFVDSMPLVEVGGVWCWGV